MTIESTAQNATQKVADTAHKVADGVTDAASDAVKATRKMANESLDKAESQVKSVQDSVDPMIDNLAAKAIDLASRSISYCAQASERARRQINDASEATYRYVSDQPGKSMLLAAATGAALATLLLAACRRDSRD